MKKLIKYIFILIIISTFSISVFATGDGNIESGGGGGTGSGTSQNKWSVGDDGVRVSIIDTTNNSVVRTPIDISNKNRSDILYHFGKNSKINYRNGRSLTLEKGSYKSHILSNKMPEIINYKGKNDINAIKKYFTSAEVISAIAEKSALPYDQLISGRYKLLLEPIMYVTYQGYRFAMTSHEAALYNEKVKNDIVYKFQSISHRALPFAMFLEVSDLGFPAYKGATDKPVKDNVIKEQLGLGIVRFNGSETDNPVPTPPSEEPVIPDIDVSTKEYDYRTDTDVISSIEISSKDNITSDNPISVTFDVLGNKHTVSDIVIPKGSNQLVWVKWHTPKEPQTVNIKVSISGGDVTSTTIKANIGELKEITPPDPTADDRNDRFVMPYLPNQLNNTSTSWTKWNCKWKENLIWVDYGTDDGGISYGEWIDKGYWEYSQTRYSASLSASMDLVPDKYNPTFKKLINAYEMKSGYGVDLKISTSVSNNGSSSDVTSAQNVNTTFSEFKYNQYNRLLEKIKSSGLNSEFEFKPNKYSPYKSRTHFTPIWYPDNNNYIVNADIIDVWTPTGMLSVTLNDKIEIKGNLWDDRHIAIVK